MTNPARTGSGSDSLATLWRQQRTLVLSSGEQLWSRLPTGDPAITIHGRDLDPSTEGTGFQFQLTMNGRLYDGRARAAYFIVQVLLTKQRTSLAWLIETMPVLEVGPGNYDLYRKRDHRYPFRDRAALQALFIRDLVQEAGAFFENVRSGLPIPGPAVPYGDNRSKPVLEIEHTEVDHAAVQQPGS